MEAKYIIAVFLLVIVSSVHGLHASDLPTPVDGLSWTFYKDSCPNLESIVKSTLELVLEQNVTQAPGLLRLLLHDCFVQGCDASILLNGTSSDPSEQQATPNLTLRAEAFKIISKIKEAVEANCSGVVSCADILALAASYAVYLVNSSKPKKFEMLYRLGFRSSRFRGLLQGICVEKIAVGGIHRNEGIRSFNIALIYSLCLPAL